MYSSKNQRCKPSYAETSLVPFDIDFFEELHEFGVCQAKQKHKYLFFKRCSASLILIGYYFPHILIRGTISHSTLSCFGFSLCCCVLC